MRRVEKRQKLEEFAQQEGIPLTLDAETTLDTTSLEDEFLHNNQVDLNKIELRRQIAAIIAKDTLSGLIFAEINFRGD